MSYTNRGFMIYDKDGNYVPVGEVVKMLNASPSYVLKPDSSKCEHEFEDHCIKCGMMAHEWANRG